MASTSASALLEALASLRWAGSAPSLEVMKQETFPKLQHFMAAAQEYGAAKVQATPVMLVDEKQQELDKLYLQVERLKSLATQERRVAAYESRRCDNLLEQLAALRKNYDCLVERIDSLTRVHAACEYRVVCEKRFSHLATTWKRETGHLSNVTKKCTHHAYQEIIGMGTGALPLILDDLRDSKDDWFWALSAITGQNPVSGEDAGNVTKMTEAWVRWGRTQGYDV